MTSYDLGIEKSGPITTNVAHFLLPRLSPLYPNIHITIRYQIHPVTGLFIYKTEDAIQCFFSPYGYDSTVEFASLPSDMQKHMCKGNKEFEYNTVISVKLIDAKVSVRAFDSGIDFSAPHKTALVYIEGHINTRSIGGAKCRRM